MIRTRGTKEEYVPIEKTDDGLYKVRWDLQQIVRPVVVKDENGIPELTGETVETDRYSWMLEYFYKKPTLKQIENLILDWYNKEVDQKILKGFKWNGMAVWLSSENQFNYKAAFDLAVQTDGGNLPTVFKFGTTASPEYHTFETLEDLTDFYTKAMTYINQCLAEGWEKKDAVDWSVYESFLVE